MNALHNNFIITFLHNYIFLPVCNAITILVIMMHYFRERAASNVSKSVSVLDLSGKEKSAKPPRRLSIPSKSAVSPLPRPTGTITPISETRMKRSTTGQGRSGTPSSDVTKSINQRKFSVLYSASYWLSQIKLSESAAKHTVSVGFFRLALESGCEPLQRMRDELKAYASRNNLLELGDPVKELLKSYNILEDLEQLQVSVTCSQVPEEGTQSADEDIQSSSATGATKLKPKSLNSESFQASSIFKSAKMDNDQKKVPANKSRGSSIPNATNLKSVSNIDSANTQKKPQRSSRRQEVNKEKAKLKNEGKKSAADKGKTDLADPSPDNKMQQEDKENVVAEQPEEISLAEVR
ncbi:hypothetical protein IFM89_018447 [Coptis chinensis]|uniref:Uncharacterized protein n=1 Tax=Coptis chinensis TaxID=261450 RepID=A0A835HW24_9MAGN|nr:hypothetical protein IFM89_018447 [Coptis chinensis]